jgi:hypothetical protein
LPAHFAFTSTPKERTMSRQSYTDKRRAQLRRKFEVLDRLEKRSVVTEPISVLGLSMSAIRGSVQLGLMSQAAASNLLHPPAPTHKPAEQTGRTGGQGKARATDFASITIGPGPVRLSMAAGGSSSAASAPTAPVAAPAPSDWLTLSAPSYPASSDRAGISSPWHPAARAGGGAAMAPRGGSGNGALPATSALVRGQTAPLRVPPPPPTTPASMFVPVAPAACAPRPMAG